MEYILSCRIWGMGVILQCAIFYPALDLGLCVFCSKGRTEDIAGSSPFIARAQPLLLAYLHKALSVSC